MVARTWVVVSLVAMAALAGCTNPSDEPQPEPRAAAPADPAPAPDDAGNDAPAGSGSATVSPRPADFEFSDAGSVQGSFEDSWDMALASPIYRSARVTFTLDGVQPGTPPAAHVNLAFLDPQGNTLRTMALGVGGEGNVADWTFAPGELLQTGAYRLVATPGQQAPVPSLGLASYGVHMTIDY